MEINTTEEFNEWLTKPNGIVKNQVRSRLLKIETDNHIRANAKDLRDGLKELKWKNGTRVYFTIIKDGESIMIVLLGGNKNGQNKDINKARKILEREKG